MEKMKNNLFIMAGAMIAALSLGACSNEDDTHGVDLSKPISLSFQPAAVVTKATVGVAADASFEKNDKVGVYVVGAGYNNVCFTNTNNVNWTASQTMYWPDASTYTIRAYYPYMETVSDVVTLPENQSGKAAFTAADRMWAGVQQPATNSAISLTLQHKMSLLKLDITAGPGMSLDAIRQMKPAILGTIPSTGTWDLTTGEITFPAEGGSSLSNIVPYLEDNETSLTYYALVMPGTKFEYGKKFFSLTDDGGTTYSYTLNIEDGFTAGASAYCDLDLTVHRTHISISGFNIDEWKAGTTGEGSVTMDY